MGEIGGADTTPQFIKSLCDQDKEVQSAAILALNRIGKSCIDQILAIILDSNACGRENAIEVLGDIGSEENTKTLLRLLREEGKEKLRLCLAIIHALGRIADPEAIPDLINQLSNDAIIDVAIGYNGIIKIQICDQAATALEKIHTREALTAVEKWRREQGGNQV